MAVPTPRGGTMQKAEGANLAVSVPPPSGVTPANGDLDEMLIETAGNDIPQITANGGTAWTQLFTISTGTGTASTRLTMYWRIFQTGDSDPSVRSNSSGLGNHICASRRLIQAGTFDAASPYESGSGWTATDTEGTSDTSFNWTPGISTLGADRLVNLGLAGGSDTSAATIPNPTTTEAGMTNRVGVTSMSTAQGNGGGFSLTRWDRAAAGGVGAFSGTHGGGVATPKAYALWAIKPVATGDTDPPNPDILTVSRNRISAQAGVDSTDVTWESDEDFTSYQLRAVPNASSTHLEGTLIEQDQNPAAGGTAGTDYTSTITDDELVAAGLSGTILVKLFTRDAAGNWSE